MSILEAVTELSGNLAWPITLVIIIFILRKSLEKLAPRLSSLKHGETELTFSELNKKIIEEKPDEEEKKKINRQQVVLSEGGAWGYYKLYSNGLLVQRFSLKNLHVSSERDVTFPTTFPNEVINIQVIGNIDVKIINHRLGGCKLALPQFSDEVEIEVIAVGI